MESADRERFDRAVASFVRSDPDWPFAGPYVVGGDFEAYVARQQRLHSGVDLPPGCVQATFLVAIDGDAIVGHAAIRHVLDDRLKRIGGHVVFGVVAEARRRGFATEILRQCLIRTRALGIHRVLVTCDDTNLGSRLTIERHGGRLADIRPIDGRDVRRYWIETERVLRTERLVLRPFVLDDVDDALAYRADPAFAEFLPHVPQPFTREHAEAFVRTNMTEPWATLPTYALVFDERVIGTVNLEIEGRRAMLGYALGRAYWGRGLAVEAARAVLAHHALDQYWASTASGNVRSMRVLDKLGMTRDGEHDGEPRYAITYTQ